jgi:hypothetical protein
LKVLGFGFWVLGNGTASVPYNLKPRTQNLVSKGVTATFFHYRHIEQLQEDIEALGVDVCLEPRVKALLEPIRIGSLVAKNSFAVRPMEGCDGTPDGKPDELVFRRYWRFGAAFRRRGLFGMGRHAHCTARRTRAGRERQ